jgi:TonB family protein
MTRDWKQWEGRALNSRFPLRQYLGGSDKSAVFLTERRELQPQRAVIKLIVTDAPGADLQISRWELAAKLSHPHLLRLFETGRCQGDDATLVYVVMEYAEDNLAQVLPYRPLTPEEAREMLESVLDALAYLHSKSFVHGRLKPANIMAAREQLKLSSDSLVAAGDAIPASRPTAYDAPEIAGGRISPASDAWSLGVTLMEALTQRVPLCDGIAEPLPEAVPAPFMGIAHCCLRRDPQRRCTATEIAARLRSASSGSQRPSTLRIPAESGKWRYLLPLAAVVLVAAFLLGPRLFNPRPPAESAQAVSSAPSPAPLSAEPTPVAAPKPSAAQPRLSPVPSKFSAPKSDREEESAKQEAKKKEETPAVSPALPPPLSSEVAEPIPAVDAGKIIERVAPSVSQSARDTIQGTVRVSVKVEVDPSGKVTNAELVSSGPSRYFARKALEAAQQWKFAPGAQGSWLLRFGFKRTGTTVVPEEGKP